MSDENEVVQDQASGENAAAVGESFDFQKFLKENLTGVIMSASMTLLCIIGFLDNDSRMNMAQKIGFVLLGLIAGPVLGFIGFSIGKKLRDMLHPDYVIASGFMGLLKEKLFWAFGPQLIGSLIGAAIGAVIVRALLGGS